VAFGDIDDDGDEDLYVQAGGFLPGDPGPTALYVNPGGNSSITLRLEGTNSNRPAIGTRVEIIATGPAGRRSLFRDVTSGSSFGANSLRLEVGLGDATAVEEVIARFPSGWVQRADGLEVGGSYEIVEGEDGARAIARKPIRLSPGD
jgi:hypothetical protein